MADSTPLRLALADCRRLLSVRGEANGPLLALSIVHRIEALDDLEWIETGIYLSRQSLGEADRVVLEQALIASVKSGAWWAALKKSFPPGVLHNHVRPLRRDARASAP